MNFTVIPYADRGKRYKRLTGKSEAILVRDNWDDYGFKTSFDLVYFDEDRERHDIGQVKVMLAGMPTGYVAIDDEFEALDPGYGSLGQDQSYYETLLELSEPVRIAILGALRDVVWNEEIRAELRDDHAYETSLARSVGDARFNKQRTIIQEQSDLTAFNFVYRFPKGNEEIVVRVDPDSIPPSNIHVVIGRNGVGKTTLLTSISALLRNGRDKRLGTLQFEENPDAAPKDQFANLITVAFSAFDNFDPPPRSASGKLRSRKAGTRSGIDYTYVGLKKRIRVRDERATGNKSEADLQEDFVESMLQCLRSASRPRWQAAMRILEADPLFAGLGLQHADLGALVDLAPEAPVDVDPVELSGLYNRVLVKGGERPLYLRLRGRSRFNRCPTCGQRDVKTLDHYLPKDQYPELAVFPANLVPCCFECNHAKLTYRAEERDEQLFHPYYDDWSGYRLVRATIDVGASVTTSFAIRSPHGVGVETIERARNHFAQLELAKLYEQHAAIELVERKPIFQSTFASNGLEGLREELAFEARSRRQANINSWQSALYRALSGSDDFCRGGFEQIDEP